MGRHDTPDEIALKHKLCTRVNDEKFKELQGILERNQNLDMSTLVRRILYNRPVTVYSRDLTLDDLMEELSKLREEINAIGVNINQITKKFNTYPDASRKSFFGTSAFSEYKRIEPKVNRLLEIISNLSKRWLRE